MVSALARILMIGFASALIIGGALFFIRWLGLSQEFAPLSHPLLIPDYLVFADGGDSAAAAPQSMTALTTLRTSCPECLPKVDVRRSLDGVWYFYGEESLSSLTNGSGYISLTSSENLDQLRFKKPAGELSTEGLIKLRDLDTLFADSPFLIVVHSRDASQLREVLDALESRKASSHVILHSPYRQILTDARKERPLWLFGVSPSHLVRVLMMEALYIETMADIWSDLIITPVTVHETTVFSERLLIELNRRHKKVILEHPQSLDQLPDFLKKSVYGVITNDFTSALEFFKSRSR
jgi:hypothetical protein